tara:strand:+ start:169128 stop:169328 length:201 start_codon:yes stop_codon:yes gene_type:complete
MSKCDRCRQESSILTGSYFNTQMICLDCEAKEQAHPDYAEAKRIENEAVAAGDTNFPGVGLPSDLR